jgi:hypothetical protein
MAAIGLSGLEPAIRDGNWKQKAGVKCVSKGSHCTIIVQNALNALVSVRQDMAKNKISPGAIVRISLLGSPLYGQSGIVNRIVCNGKGAMVRLKSGQEGYWNLEFLEPSGQWPGPWEKWGEE